MKKIFYLLIILLCIGFFSPSFAQADISITEIMYDADGTDTEREWLEVYNSGPNPVDLASWYFFSDNTKHTLVPISSGIIGVGEYGVIVQNVDNFKIDWPDFTGLIYDSSWTGFNNTGEAIALKDPDLNLVGSVTFSSSGGGNGDGHTLQKIGSSWVGATPTPGRANEGTSSTTNDSTTNPSNTYSTTTTTASSSSKSTSVSKVPEVTPKIQTEIISKPGAFVGLAYELKSKTLGYSKEVLDEGKFIWSLGDGSVKESFSDKPFYYTYQYPGDYVVTLDYYLSALSTEPIATDRLVITVMSTDILIARVGDTKDPFVELENKSTREVNLSKWILKNQNHFFQIPNGTIILPGKKIILSSRVTGFTLEDIQNLVLTRPDGEVASVYPHVISNNSKTYSQVLNTRPNTQGKAIIDKDNVIDLSSQSASASGARIVGDIDIKFLILLALVVILGCIVVFLIQKRSLNKQTFDGFSAEDIKIIE